MHFNMQCGGCYEIHVDIIAATQIGQQIDSFIRWARTYRLPLIRHNIRCLSYLYMN